MSSNEAYASLMQVYKDYSKKEDVLKVVKYALEAHLQQDATVDLEVILDMINKNLTQNNK
jgi:20S proteasome alpha/beta subunit